MMQRAVVVTGLVGLAAGLAAGQTGIEGRGQLQRLANGIEVQPLRRAPAVRGPDGFHKVGDWVPVGDSAGRACDDLELSFDAFEQTGSCTGGYYFYGTGYCNMFVTNDMTVSAETDLDTGFRRIDFAWQWTCSGFGTEPCIVGVFTQDSVPCDDDSFEYSGWLLDFGTLSCNPGGYYYSNADLSSAGTWPVPDGGTGSYALFFAQEVTTSGALLLATCAQPMLWATGEDRGDPSAPGTQGPEQLDDDNPADGDHGTGECYDYTIDECPFELGAAAGFWQERCDDPCDYANYNGDSTVNTQDFLDFLNSWNAGDARANCNGDSTVNTQDFLCFLNIWNACR
ncbi:MAG: hypothetical protein HND58_12435 [Planctomycetota bacterium]|nr:MAG: hypothetical protein HND58_12435 [Planctomycetota bacterium]